MKAFICAMAMAGIFAAGSAWGTDAAPASDASIRQLLEITNARTMLDGIMSQMRTTMQKSALQSVGHPLDVQEQQILSSGIGKVMDTFQNQLAWDKFEPIMVEIYRKNLSQQEVNDMLVFYRSPTGRALIAKMPVLQQEGGEAGQRLTQAAIPQARQIFAQMMDDMKAHELDKAKKASQAAKP
ncbi:DUF2059 domain-containing protein [Dyella flagellata]|uniref:DUF2059 domain-containing protein n=1 Tax=Dyella flagellata TaxID=1867833 RepID=A0ABQ5XGI6_9GAMM|nr:DUF2059 domain-containing protein [Dyella flagellata]GLQ90316.1 hypothetical protein GCM10007898_38910 [Dyella flagellata]